MGDVLGFRYSWLRISFLLHVTYTQSYLSYRTFCENSSWRMLWIILLHIWTGNASFVQNLTSWLVRFRLVLLDWALRPPHFHCSCCYVPNTVCLVAGRLLPVLQILFSTLSMLPTLVGQFALHAPCCHRFFIKITSSCEIFLILFNFY